MRATPGNGGTSGGSDRGQTLHDYVAGISVFLITLSVVLTFLPSVIAPYSGESSPGFASGADRIADRIVSNLSTASTPNRLNMSTVSAIIDEDSGALAQRYGLQSWANINITVTSLDGERFVRNASGDPMTSGATAFDEDTSSVTRVVTFDRPTANGACKPACRLEVKAW